MTLQNINLTVNGEAVSASVEARRNLVDFLRENLELTGSHIGCEHGVCGACTIRVDGAIVRGCLMLAAQVDGAVIDTVEGLSDSGERSPTSREPSSNATLYNAVFVRREC